MITEMIMKHCRKYKYSREFMIYWLRHVKCEVPECSKWAAAPHHIRSRGAGGKDNPENLISLCTDHHTEIHCQGHQHFALLHPSLRSRFETAKGAPR